MLEIYSRCAIPSRNVQFDLCAKFFCSEDLLWHRPRLKNGLYPTTSDDGYEIAVRKIKFVRQMTENKILMCFRIIYLVFMCVCVQTIFGENS